MSNNNSTNNANVKKYSEEDVQRMIIDAIAKFKNETAKEQKKKDEEEYVTILFIGAMAEDSVFDISPFGYISRAGEELLIPKRQFLQQRTYRIDKLLKKRVLIVTNGLTDEERKRIGVLYTQEELLSADMYYSLFDYSRKDICRIFKSVCPEHKRVIATMYITAYYDGDNRINRDTVEALEALSRDVDPNGLFKPILDGMSKR